MARENRSDRGAKLALASVLVVFSLAVIALPASAYYYDTDGDGLPDFYEIKHGLHGSVTDERADWDSDLIDDADEDKNGNGIVDIGETDPYNPDTDGDGLWDGIELGVPGSGTEGIDTDPDGDGLVNALDLDSDNDFIPDAVEEQIQLGDLYRDGIWEGLSSNETDWLNPDTDGDDLIDGWEFMWGTDPLNANTDGDAWDDGYEVYLADYLAPGIQDQITDPTNPDCDGDGRLDGVGNEDGADADGDGIINALDFDSDNDGLIDSDEDSDESATVDAGETDPEVYDTDGDGFSDGYEIYHAYSDPLDGGVDSDGDGWANGMEVVIWKTDPNDADTDDDGIGDGIENPLGNPGRDTDGDGLIDALDLDSDNDGIDDDSEDVDGDGVVDAGETSPILVDTDGDELPDNFELQVTGTDPTDAADPYDTDGISAGDEIHSYKTNFDTADTDGDGVDEGTGIGTDRANYNTDSSHERPYGDSSVDALDRDADGDGLWDGDEVTAGTDPFDRDTDGDGLFDGQEVHIWGTDPLDDDSDNDGLEDGPEVETYGTDPLDANTDDDYVNDGVEVNSWGSNPLDPDSDGDGIIDGETISGHYIDGTGATVNWSFTEDDSDAELGGGDGLPNVLDTDSDWRETQLPSGAYLFLHDRTELAYEAYVTAKKAATDKRFEAGPLNPGNPDTDGDGVVDALEVANYSDPLDARDAISSPAPAVDSDGDGLYDIEEYVLEGVATPTMHLTTDFDGDGLFDGDEVHPSWWDVDGFAQTHPSDPDDSNSDSDPLNDFAEVVTNGTNPLYHDTDGDGINDNVEVLRGYDPTDFDMDDDELYDGQEDVDQDGTVDAAETDPQDGDTDDDGIYDGPELTYGTDPRDTDTDGDTIWDGWEVGYNAGNIGADTDGPTFGPGDQDTATKTDPRLVDSDFDGIDDNLEDLDGDGQYDPLGLETDAQSRDSDGDDLPDYYEYAGNNPAVAPATTYALGWVDNSLDPTLAYNDDTDGDGLEDGLEFEQMTDPDVITDSDGDGIIDGDEYYSWLTDPTNTDTDSDGCQEHDTVVVDATDLTDPLTIENVQTDADGDGINNAMDVDSDNDWVWDGDGGEDCGGAGDVDSDGIPNIQDSDTDNDNLSDVQEMGLDTWHQFADNDRDFDEDGVLDGDEYYHAIHQPHTGEVGFRASDPKDYDTDNDGLHDGFEVGKTAGYPVDPIVGGTNPDPGVWDFDGTANSHVGHWDSDMDGLTDFEEDADMDGDDTDIGVGNSETDPEDDDTDDEGLIDGYEVTQIGSNPIACDTDADGLPDGLEWGIQGAMGDNTSWSSSACYGVGLDYRDDVDYGAYTTNPLDDDTDDDTLVDGFGEDVDLDGFRDGNTPFDLSSDWATTGETDPNEWDTDRGGQDDGTEVGLGDDPLLYTDGDWDIDIDNDDQDVSANLMDIGADDGVNAVPPGSSGTADFIIYHTDGSNPDVTDGPSTATAPLDTVYFRATSLHWGGGLLNYTYSVPDTNKTDWIHYSAISFSPAMIQDFAPGTSQIVTVTANVPEGAMPGWYTGYVQAETKRDIEQELPDDWFTLHVYVAPQKDLDIDDDDEFALGVGLASDPADFPVAAAYGEMHLAGAPTYPGDVTGTFWLANPNTNPDGQWPYPGTPVDGINDFNGLPAIPEVALCWDPPSTPIDYTWDRNTLDPQGNVNLTYQIEAQYEHTSGPMSLASAISFDSPLTSGMGLGTKDSFDVTIDTTLLPEGLYQGVVRVFEDVDGDNVYDGGETFDAFILYLWLVIPDFDIDDDYANMSGNAMTISVDPGAVDVMIGEIKVVCPDTGNNYDAWDGPSDESLFDFQYYSPTYDELRHIPSDGVSQPASFFVFSPDRRDSIEIWIDGLMGDVLMIGQEKKLRLRLPTVPANLPAGTYRTDHPASWIPGDGTVPICSRGLATGMGWLPGEFGPSVVYDPDIPVVETLMDYFHLTVEVKAVTDVEFDAALWTVTGDPGEHVCQATLVNNLGNADVSDVHFDVTQLGGATDPFEVILPGQIDFEPSSIDIALGDSESVDICVDIPNGQYAQTYEGYVSLLADGDEEFDQLPVNVIVNCIPEMDISQNAYGVSGNLMVLTPGDGGTPSKQYEICNLGNCEVTGFDYEVIDLPDGIDVSVVTSSTLDWQECDTRGVTATWGSPWPDAGTYHGEVEITADGGLSDYFALDVVVAPDMEVDENEADVLANVMTLMLGPSYDVGRWVAEGDFVLVNTGVTDLSGIAALDVVIPGAAGAYVTVDVDIASTCDWDDDITGTVEANWDIGDQNAFEAMTIETTVTLTANGGISDNFILKIVIEPIKDAEFVTTAVSEVGVAGEILEAEDVTFEVENAGNTDLASGDVTFGYLDLVGPSGSVIPAANIAVAPATKEITYEAGEVEFGLRIAVPEGLLGQAYSGEIILYVEGEEADRLDVTVTLERGEDDIVIYPNPYRMGENEDGITIALGDVGTDLTIMVYDMFGALVADLTADSSERSTDVQWDLKNDDGASVASGMYIVTIDTGDEVFTRKIMVIK
jgi:hypothetical protein